MRRVAGAGRANPLLCLGIITETLYLTKLPVDDSVDSMGQAVQEMALSGSSRSKYRAKMGNYGYSRNF